MLILPQRFRSQPQYPAPVHPGWREKGLVAAFVFDNRGYLIDRAGRKKYTAIGGETGIEKDGKALYLNGSSYINTGVQSLEGVSLFADSSSRWSAIVCAKLSSTAASGTYLARAGTSVSSRTFQLVYDSGLPATASPAVILRGTQTNTAWRYDDTDWHQFCVTWDGTTARAYGDISDSAVLSVGTAAEESENIVFGARTGGTAVRLNGMLAYAYFFNRAISQQTHRNLYENPWQIFETPRPRLWVATIDSAVDLAISTSVQANTLSGVPISHDHVLVISASIQVSSTSAVSVTQTHLLACDHAAQGNMVDAVPITTLHDLVIRSLSQVNSAIANRVTTHQTLAFSSAIQNNRVSAGATSNGVFIESALVGGIAAPVRIKKPGIPVGTAEWLRTLLEILIGRRGNKITPIAFQELTFSAPPTKAECEALYEYMNKIRTALNDVITRLDS